MRTSSIKIEQLKLYHFKDYVDNGKSLRWYENGQKRWEDEYQNGEIENMITYEKVENNHANN